MTEYFGAYKTFHTLSKKEASVLISADCLIGDRFSLSVEIIDGSHVAWLNNKFNKTIGFFDPDTSRQISLLLAEGLELCAVLSLVAFSEGNPLDDPGFSTLPNSDLIDPSQCNSEGYYWGQVALFAFPPAETDAFNRFIDNVSSRIENNIHPDINLNVSSAAKVVESEGSWEPEKTIPSPKAEKGMAIIKCRRSISDKLIEQGRKGNKGCYLISWVFLLALVAFVIFGLKACGLF